MAKPSAEEVTQVKEAVKQCVTEAEYKDFDEDDFELLWREEYRSAAALKKASRKQLASTKLPGALVDYLKPSQGVQPYVTKRSGEEPAQYTIYKPRVLKHCISCVLLHSVLLRVVFFGHVLLDLQQLLRTRSHPGICFSVMLWK